jgi:hypothetical protein
MTNDYLTALNTAIIPAGVMPWILDKADMFSGRVFDSFSFSSFVSPESEK